MKSDSHVITLLHTSPVHVATFGALFAELAPDLPVQHVVHVRLLEDARAHGFSATVRDDVTAVVRNALASDGVVMCTCSTVGGLAEAAGAMRVDRAMADRAIQLGSRIVVVAALASTLMPTQELVQDAADRAGKCIEIATHLCVTAWPYFEAGDIEGYLANVAVELQSAVALGDVVVLAQASMARAVERCASIRVPILSSPRLGVAAAIDAWQRRAHA